MKPNDQTIDFSTPIPFIGIPILNRGDLLKRCIESIDYPVDRIAIINNGSDPSVEMALRDLASPACCSVPISIEVATYHHNLGVAASWNRFLKEEASYHLIVNNDVQFLPGTLRRMHRFALRHRDAAILCGHAFSCFALHPCARDQVGEFDENFYPGYFEDDDYAYRARLAGVRLIRVPGIKVAHGEAPPWHGSATVLSNAQYLQRSEMTLRWNAAFYREKWGGLPGQEVFTHPFNNSKWPPQKWELDWERRKQCDIWER